MRRSSFLLLCTLILSLAGLAAAQQGPAEVNRIYFATPKPGMEAQFEKGVRAHMDFHRQRKDTWRWNVRYTQTGASSGEYIFISPGHPWKSFDNPAIPPQDDGENYSSTVGPYVASQRSIILVARPDLNFGPAPSPAGDPLAVVTYFHLKYGKGPQFEHLVRQFRDAMSQTGAPGAAHWYTLAASGRNAVFVLSSPRANWAGFEMPGGPSNRERLDKAHGAGAADAFFRALEEVVDYTESKITSARPDLSYVP
jgi:hypothetical protein